MVLAVLILRVAWTIAEVLLAGVLYFLTVWLGYSQPDMAGHAHDYGTKFLVAAGLLNLLGIVDAWEIATGKKD